MQLALDSHRTTVVLDDVLHNRETKSGPAGLARAAGIDAVKALKQARQVLVRDAFAKVAHVKLNRFSVSLGAKLDLPASLAVLQRVFDQISEHLLDRVTIALHHFIGALGDLDLESLFAGGRRLIL